MLKKDEPFAAAGDCRTNTALAFVKTSKATQLKKPRPIASNATVGSLAASYVCSVPACPWIVWKPSNCGEFECCRNGGSRSPQCAPLSVDQSMPHWLKPTRLSFWPASRLWESVGLNVMSVSAWRRKLQSWLTRVFCAPAFRPPQPIAEFGVCPMRSASLVASAPSSRSSALASVAPEIHGSGRRRARPFTWTGIDCRSSLPLAASCSTMSGSPTPDAGRPPTSKTTTSTAIMSGRTIPFLILSLPLSMSHLSPNVISSGKGREVRPGS